MRLLVIGGAGYVGSHAVRHLLERADRVAVLDNLSTGHRAAVPADIPFFCADVRDTENLGRVLAEERPDVVLHFAAFSLVGESVQNPVKYYDNNITGAISLVKAMADCGAGMIVFSSTAAVYGEPDEVPISEEANTEPTNPYGETKLTMEKLFHWAEGAYGIRHVSLRYFNAAGADPSGAIGEDHSPESHLIPLVLQVPAGKREAVSIFGTDYPTPDGTCLRDYIHVTDLAQAHGLAVSHLMAGGESDIFNLGNGNGFSVREIIDTCREVTGHPIPAKEESRRAGDPAILVASSEKAKRVLGWKPEFAEPVRIVETAWQWHSTHPDGYGD